MPSIITCSRLHGTPKVHKPGNKVRPIVDYTGSIWYNTFRALADILTPLLGKTEHRVVNSKHLAEDLAQVYIEEGEIFNSHDVVSLFTNSPVDKSLEVIKAKTATRQNTQTKNFTLGRWHHGAPSVYLNYYIFLIQGKDLPTTIWRSYWQPSVTYYLQSLHGVFGARSHCYRPLYFRPRL